MKNRILFFSFIYFLILISCSSENKQQEHYSIQAEITGLEDSPVKLMKLDLATNESVIVDTCTAVNENFSFTGKVESPYMHTLYLVKPDIKIHLFLENSNMLIRGDVHSPNEIEVSGSHEDSLFRSYSIDDIFDPNKGMEIMLNYPDYNYAAMVAYYQFQYSKISIDTMDLIIRQFSPEVKKSEYFKYLNKLYKAVKRVAINQIAPAFSIPDTSGKVVHLSDFRGKYVLLDFWAAWCAPCRKANPVLRKIYDKFHRHNFTIIGISVDNNRKQWLNAIRKDSLPWTNVSFLNGWDSITDLYAVKAVPQNFLLNPEGIIIAKNLEPEKLSEYLEHLLNQDK